MKTLFLTLLCCGLFATSASALTLVDFSNAENTFGSPDRAPTGDSPNEVPWDTSTPLLNEPTLNSAVIYGGWYNDGGIKRWLSAGDSTADLEGLRVGDSNGEATTGIGALLWQKADFVNNSGSQVDLTTGTTFETLTYTGNSNDNLVADVRWLVYNDATVYVSDIVGQTNTKENYDTLSGTLDGLDWFAVDLAGGMNSAISGTATDAATVFTDIEGVGVYYQSPGEVDQRIFEFSVTQIPEPSAGALLLTAVTLGLAFRRRRAS